MLRYVKSKARSVRSILNQPIEQKLYDSLLLQGRQASWHVRAMKAIESLEDVEFRVFSQWGEDGIIDWLIERAALPASLHTFVEFGVESYGEANTRFLAENRNWRGLVMDGDPALGENLKRDPRGWRYGLTSKSAFITRENVNELIFRGWFLREIGLLSVDVDGNDYWIWEAISVVQPVICVCEYNSVFGDLEAVSVPYDSGFVWGQTHSRFVFWSFGPGVGFIGRA